MNIISGTDAFTKVSTDSSHQLKKTFDLCIRKTRANIKRLADEPKSAAWAIDGNYFDFKEDFYEIGNWTSSFFTGMALLAWQEIEDEYFLNQVLRLAPHYREKVFTRHLDTHHDLGFLYSLYSVALYKLTGDQEHREVGLRAAQVLAQRFNPKGNFIRAWGRMNTTEYDNMAIIDCLMNLPLLHWAATETGDKQFSDVAVNHADKTLQHFIRPDHSVYHAYRFDLQTGAPLGGDTYGGWDVESHWARGAAWAIYGFALSYRYTHERKFLDAARRLAEKFADNLDDEIIPLWDFKSAAGTPLIRDASAASIAVCGFQELAGCHSANLKIMNCKRALLRRLCHEDYLNLDEHSPAIQKNGQVGNGDPGGAQNACTSWGDFFLMQALAAETSDFNGFW